MAAEMPLHATQVLAIASHVTYGYVGNKMATFVMQALGCDVSAIDTVHFSNHTAYKQFRGRRVPAEEIEDIYEGLKQSNLNDFDMLLSGYAASKEVVEVVGKIARDVRYRTTMKPGSFFWILDPVMGDEGRLYVAGDIVPAYRSLLPHADLILPNAFEAELLSDTQITDMDSLIAAITKLHKTYQVPHIVVTSLRISPKTRRRMSNAESDTLVVVGSSCRKDLTPRPFVLTAPSLPIFFSGTGDMFAALMLCRLREAVVNFETEAPHDASEIKPAPRLTSTRSWIPPDEVPATKLPLAKATEKVLASMHVVLQKTAEQRREALGETGARAADLGVEDENFSEGEKKLNLLKSTKASEVRVVKYVNELRDPPVVDGVTFEAQDVQPAEEPRQEEKHKAQLNVGAESAETPDSVHAADAANADAKSPDANRLEEQEQADNGQAKQEEAEESRDPKTDRVDLTVNKEQ